MFAPPLDFLNKADRTLLEREDENFRKRYFDTRHRIPSRCIYNFFHCDYVRLYAIAAVIAGVGVTFAGIALRHPLK